MASTKLVTIILAQAGKGGRGRAAGKGLSGRGMKVEKGLDMEALSWPGVPLRSCPRGKVSSTSSATTGEKMAGHLIQKSSQGGLGCVGKLEREDKVSLEGPH